MIPIDPKTSEEKGGIAIIIAAVAAFLGWLAGKGRSKHEENIRRKKLDKKELARHKKIKGDR